CLLCVCRGIRLDAALLLATRNPDLSCVRRPAAIDSLSRPGSFHGHAGHAVHAQLLWPDVLLSPGAVAAEASARTRRFLDRRRRLALLLRFGHGSASARGAVVRLRHPARIVDG